MNRQIYYLFLFSILIAELCSGKPNARPSQVPNEWILTRVSSRTSWKSILEQIPSKPLFLRAFGDRKQHALVKAKEILLGRRSAFSVQPNFLYYSEKTDPDLSKSWAIENTGQIPPDGFPGTVGVDVSAKQAWSLGLSKNSVVVAVLDSGIDLVHEELRNEIWRNGREIPDNHLDDDGNGYIDDVTGWNFVDNTANAQDDNNHGTFVSGIIAAEPENGVGSRGIAEKTKVLPIKVLDRAGVGTTAGVVSGIEYAVKMGANILNASWGGTEYDPLIFNAMKSAGDAGLLIVAASGNDGKDNDRDPRPIYPASFKLPQLISVAAYDNRDRLAAFSNYGKESTHLGAPGVGIYSTIVGGHKYSDGTSYAAPQVSGVAALLLSAFPALKPSETKKRLMDTSDVIGYYEKEHTKSAGRVNAYQALKDIRPPRPVPPSKWLGGLAEFGTQHPYAHKESQIFKASFPGAARIRVHFKGFDTESCCDVVTVKDSKGVVVAAYSGKLGDFWSADAIGDSLFVEWRSDYSISAYGFDVDSLQYSNEPFGLSVKNSARPLQVLEAALPRQIDL